MEDGIWRRTGSIQILVEWPLKGENSTTLKAPGEHSLCHDLWSKLHQKFRTTQKAVLPWLHRWKKKLLLKPAYAHTQTHIQTYSESFPDSPVRSLCNSLPSCFPPTAPESLHPSPTSHPLQPWHMLPWQPHSLLSLSFYLHNLILLECTLYLVCLFTISPWKLGTLSHRGRCVSPMPPPWLWYCIMLIFFGGSEVKVSAWNVLLEEPC